MSRSYTADCSLPPLEVWTDASTEEGNEHPSPLSAHAAPLDQTLNSSTPVVQRPQGRGDYRETGTEELDEDASPYWGSGKGSDDGVSAPSSPLGPKALADIGISFAMLYPTLESHPYSIKDVHRWSRRMLTPEEFRVLKGAAFRLEPDSLPRSELTGLYFNKHRPCWSVDYYSRQRKRKTIDFFVPDVRHSTLALVLKCASACRLVLPRRFEDVPLWIPEPDESTGGLPYRAGATFLEPSILNWVLLNRPRGEVACSSSETKRLHDRTKRGEFDASLGTGRGSIWETTAIGDDEASQDAPAPATTPSVPFHAYLGPNCGSKPSPSFLVPSDTRRKAGYSLFESPQKNDISTPLAVSPALSCDSCTDSRIGTSLVTPEAQSPVHEGGSGHLLATEQFLYLPERLGANEQQQQQHRHQQPQQMCGFAGQQSVGSSYFFASQSSPQPGSQRYQGRGEVLQQARPCYGGTATIQEHHHQPHPHHHQQLRAELTRQAFGSWGTPSGESFVRGTPQADAPVSGSLASFASGKPPSNSHVAVVPETTQHVKRRLEREKAEVRCIRKPAVLPIPVPRLDERLFTATERLEPPAPTDLLWGGDGGIEAFVALSPHSSLPYSTRGTVSCWGLPIDMLRDWYSAAEGEGDDITMMETSADYSNSSNEGVFLPFRVTQEEIAAAAELARDPFTSPLAAG